MPRHARYVLRLLAMLIALGAVIGIAAHLPVSTGPMALAQDEADLWVKQHRDELPATLSDLTQHPKVRRDAIIRALAVGVQGRLWREHVESFLTPQDALSPLQQAIVVHLDEPLSDAQLAFLRWSVDQFDEIFDPLADLTAQQSLANPICEQAIKPATK